MPKCVYQVRIVDVRKFKKITEKELQFAVGCDEFGNIERAIRRCLEEDALEIKKVEKEETGE